MKFIKNLFKYTLLALLSFFIFVIASDIFYPVSIYKTKDTSKIVYDSSKNWLYTTTNQSQKWRFKPEFKRIDPLYIKMLVNFEDKRFNSHFGVDVAALFRASYQLATRGHIVSGGSTLTMQVARLLEPKRRTFSSKIVEIIRALQLEHHYTKRQILNIYLTLAPYGGNVEGIEAASWYYFGKHPYALSASEAAMLVALPKNPEAYRPDKHPKRAKMARDRVLKKAYDAGILSDYIYKQALKEPIATKLYKFPRYAPHLALKLLQNSSKAKIYTTIDGTLQKQLELWAKERGKSLPNGASMAMLIVENSSSKVRAYLGSYNMFNREISGYIDMTDAIRSPGSALKPFIYALGFEQHIIHPQTIILDKEVSFGNYHPHNYSRKFHGQVTISEALKNSLNIPAVKVLYRVGAGRFIDRLQKVVGKVHIPKNSATLPIALGGLGISLKQLTQGYVTLANAGSSKSLAILEGEKQHKLNFVDAKSAKTVTAILRQLPPPENYRDRADKIAYKTGTSYGYRDFWSMGYSKNYTIGVWVGKANNQPVVKLSAREIATPIMFEAFSLTDAIKGLKQWSWSSNFIKNQAPKVLKYFDKELKSQDKLKFLYPKKGARYQSASCHKVTVKVAIDNGKEPYYFYVDNKPKDIESKRVDIKLGVGGHTISVLDSSGESITRNIWVDMPDCQEE